ncbi:calcium-binding protein, partial [Escherichia coli]|nr:calcium-binding protein [Escherichia coli]
MASIQFTYQADFNPANTVVQSWDGMATFPDRSQAYAFGPSPIIPGLFSVFKLGAPETGILFADKARGSITIGDYSVSADFSDNTGSVDLTGGLRGDVLTGGSNRDILKGGGGDDALSGGGSHDILEGGAGADALDGGSGSDWASYENASSAVRVYLNPASAGNMAGDASGDLFVSIENIRGSAYGDVLVGDAGNNVLEGGAGADFINGDGGFNTVTYANSSAGVNVNLLTGVNSGGDAADDYALINIQGLRGSLHDDVLTGDNANNVLNGLGSDGPLGDALLGMGGNDRLLT